MIDWTKINSVFLDLDGTLLDLHFDNHFWLEYVPKCYAEHHQLALDESHRRLGEKYKAVYGSLDWYCVDYWTRELGMDIASLKHSAREKIAVRPHVREFLESLHMHGKRVVLVTNAHPVSIEIKMQETGLERYFNRIITSHELRLPKEDIHFWHRLQEVEAFDLRGTLFIDDNFSVLDAASEYGLSHLLAIRQPDSQSETKSHHHYHLLDSFMDIMPG